MSKLNKYSVTIQEVRTKAVIVTAKNGEEAFNKVQDSLHAEEGEWTTVRTETTVNKEEDSLDGK